MSPQTKAVIQRVVAGVLLAIIVGLAGAVLTDRDRVTALEIKIQGVEDGQTRLEGQIEKNRVENRDDHQRIIDEIKGLRK